MAIKLKLSILNAYVTWRWLTLSFYRVCASSPVWRYWKIIILAQNSLKLPPKKVCNDCVFYCVLCEYHVTSSAFVSLVNLLQWRLFSCTTFQEGTEKVQSQAEKISFLTMSDFTRNWKFVPSFFWNSTYLLRAWFSRHQMPFSDWKKEEYIGPISLEIFFF